MYICIYIKQDEVKLTYYKTIKECKEWAKEFGHEIKQRKFTEWHHFDEKNKINVYIKDVSDCKDLLADLIK